MRVIKLNLNINLIKSWKYFSYHRSFGTVSKVRQGFGSFHSNDIEQIIRSPNLIQPNAMLDIHENITLYNSEQFDGSKFNMGLDLREFAFNLDNSWTFINHGAFGAVMQPMLLASEQWRRHCEKQPLRFFDRDLFPSIAYTLQQVAKLFHCPAEELYPLQNVTSGLNSVLQSIHLSEGDEVICFSLTYGSTKKMLQDLCLRTGAVLRIVHIPLPVSGREHIIAKLADALNEKTRLLIIDEITSNTALMMPTIELAQLGRQAGALVVVDAAHVMMSQHVRIYPQTNATPTTTSNSLVNDTMQSSLSDVVDVWITNAHKWFCAPKGSAFMWVHPATAPHIRTAIVSHGYLGYQGDDRLVSRNRHPRVRWWHEEAVGRKHGNGTVGASPKLLSALAWDGCRDYTALLSVPIGLHFWGMLQHCNHDFASQRTSAATSLSMAEAGSTSRPSPGMKNSISSNATIDIDAAHRGMSACRAYSQELLHRNVVPTLYESWGLSEDDHPAPASLTAGSPMALVNLRCFISTFYTTYFSIYFYWFLIISHYPGRYSNVVVLLPHPMCRCPCQRQSKA